MNGSDPAGSSESTEDVTPAQAEPLTGKVIPRRRLRISAAWIFPLIALGVCGWVLWSNWESQGPLIEIHFAEAPGIQAGKSVLIYRGVTAGEVTRVHLDENLSGVVVAVRLKAFAAELAATGTDFWIDQPVISLREVTGLDAIVQGNSLHARRGAGPPATTFTGLPGVPVLPLEEPALTIWLTAPTIPFLDRGTPVYHQGVHVGDVRTKGLTASGQTFLQVVIDDAHRDLVRANSRFWSLPSTQLDITPSGVTLAFAGIEAIADGAITFENFEPAGPPADDHAGFPLATDELAARASSPAIQIFFDNGHGLTAGQTRVNYLGQPVGLVEHVAADPATGLVETSVRLNPDFARLTAADSVFTLIRPQISLEGVTGLDTLVTGPYIAFEPGSAPESAKRFVGRSVSGADWARAQAERDGIEVIVEAPNLPSVEAGAPLFHRGLIAGSVRESFLAPSGNPALRVVVHRDFRTALRANSRFWRVPATSVQLGAGLLSIDVESVAALIQGGIAFDTFDDPGPAATADETFALHLNRHIAESTSPPIRITFPTGRGLTAGRSDLRYLGLPVGYVSRVTTRGTLVEVTAHVKPEYNFLRHKGSTFAIVEPSLSIEGASGIDTLLTGVFIECVPGPGPAFAESFTGETTSQPELLEERGFEITLTSAQTRVGPGAPIFFRDVQVGEITAKKLAPDATSVVLTASIQPAHQDLVTAESQFWEASGLDAQLGPIKLQIRAPSLLAPEGRIAFTNPTGPTSPPAPNASYPLLAKPPSRGIWPFSRR